MSKEQISDFERFLEPFDKEVRVLVFWLREFVWDLYPEANELIYDNYNALAFGWSITEKVGHLFCNIAVGRTTQNIQFGFYWGSELKDKEKLLLGNGSQYRYIRVKAKNEFPSVYIKTLLNDAYLNSLAKVKNEALIVKGKTIVKSISAKKRTSKGKGNAKAKGKSVKGKD